MCDNRRGKLIVLSGFSGAGKGTLLGELFKNHPGEYALSVSMTTRKPRPGEVEGVSYFFRTQEEFNKKVEEDYFAEYALYADNSYGTPVPYLVENMDAGKNVICEIELQGALQLKKKFPDARMIFITTKDADTLESRLRGRGTETDEVIKKRLTRAIKEAEGVENYDAILVNGDLSASAEALHNLIGMNGKAENFDEMFVLVSEIRSALKSRFDS